MLAEGIDIETRLTALILAAQKGHTEIVQLLLAAGVNNLETFQYRLDKIQYQGEIDKAYQCPISMKIMNDPIAVSSGQTYDRASLKRLFNSQKESITRALPVTISCPLTRKPIKQEELRNSACIFIKQHIEDFVAAKEKEAKESISMTRKRFLS